MLRNITFFGLICAFAPHWVYADAIRITSGTFTESASSVADFVFAGGTLQLSGTATNSSGLLTQCSNCEPGEQFSLSGWWDFEGQAEQDGSLLPVTGRLNFHSGNGQISELAVNARGELTRAFAFVGTVSGLEGSSNPLHLVGHGLVLIRFFHAEGEGILPTLIRYDFSASETTVTPEPATLALVGSGLLGAVVARRKRRTP